MKWRIVDEGKHRRTAHMVMTSWRSATVLSLIHKTIPFYLFARWPALPESCIATNQFSDLSKVPPRNAEMHSVLIEEIGP